MLTPDLESSIQSILDGPPAGWDRDLEELCRANAHAAAAIRAEAQRLRGKLLDGGLAPDESMPRGGSDEAPNWIGPYRILDTLGEGGMGTVYLAEQKKPVRRRVAVKVVKLGMDTKQVLNRFEAERQALAMMEHGNIARVLDAGATEAGRPYFAMEYVKGMPLTRYCDQNKLDLGERLGLFRQVCSAVQHAHTKGVIHRDLKPSNLLVTVQDGKPRVKIIDFGLARATDHRLVEQTLYTQFGQVIGTPEYMSPEQAGLGETDVDTRTDVYSLGVVLYELLTGSLPFDAVELRRAGLLEVQRKIREDDPPKPSTKLTTLSADSVDVAGRRRTSVSALQRELRGDLDWVVMKALEKDRTRRYTTADALADDVERYLRREPVNASPPNPAYRFRKLMQRHRNTVAAAGVVMVSLIGGIVGTTYGLLDARAERATADERARQARASELRANAAELRATEESREARFASYDSGLYAAQAALQRAAHEEARRLLAECPQEHRGFEWHYLSAQLAPSLLVLEGHEHAAQCVCFSPDSRRIVSGSRDATLRIWDASTGETVAVLHGHTAEVEGVAYSPDGRHIVSASVDKTVGIWDAQTNALAKVLTGHALAVKDVAYSPDGSKIASISGPALGDGDDIAPPTLRVWDAQSGAELSVQPCPMPERPRFANCGPRSVTYTRDGSRVVVAYDNGAILVFDPQGQVTAKVLRAGGDHAWTQVASNPSNDWIVSSGQRLKLWDPAAGENPLDVPSDQRGTTAYGVAFSPDGTRIVCGSTDGTVRIRSATRDDEIANLRGHDDVVLAVACSPDGTRVVSASQDRTLRVWSASSPVHHDVEVLLPSASVVYDSSGSRILSVGPAGLQVWDTATLAQIRVFRNANAWTAAWNPDGTCVVTGSEDGGVDIWDIGTGRCRRLEPHKEQVFCVAWSPDGALIAACGLEQQDRSVAGGGESGAKRGFVRLWDARSAALLQVLAAPVTHGSQLQFARDGSRLACTSQEGARLWDVATSKEVPVLAEGAVWAFDGNGHLVVANPSAEGSRVSDAATGELRVTLPLAVDELVFAADGRRIFARSTDDTLRILDARTGRPWLAFDGGKSTGRGSFAISPDSSQVTLQSGHGVRIHLSDLAKSRVMAEAKNARRRAAWQILKQHRSLDRGLESLHRAGLLNDESAFLVFEIAHARGDVAAESEDAAWSSVKSPGNTADAYELAFFRALVAAHGQTDRPLHLLGAASYRLGAYSLASQFLRKSRQPGRAKPIAAAFAAMNTLAREGDESDHAWRERREFLELLKVPANREDPDCQALAAEIERLFAAVRPRRERAQRLATELLATAGPIEAALDRLRSAHEADAFVERLAAQIVERRPSALNNQSWATVKSSGATAQEYEAALAQAIEACRLDPKSGHFLNTLAVAQYRVGHYEEALGTLRRSDGLNSTAPTGGLPSDVAFLAMTLLRLERAEEAARERSRLMELMKNPEHGRDAQYQSFLREVEELFHR